MKTETTAIDSDRSPAGGIGVPRKWLTHYRRLLAIRDRLQGDRRRLILDQKNNGPIQGSGHADNAADEFDRGVILDLLSRESVTLSEVEDALDRIANGTYGICQLTGKRIPETRLKAVPWAQFTAEAQLQHEGSQAR